MLFNSLHFIFFFSLVFLVYWSPAFKKVQIQNIFLLISSYYFYSCWDSKFLILLIFSTLLDYYTGIKISQSITQKIRKRWLFISILINVGFLAIFKYFNFFIDSFMDLGNIFGIKMNLLTISIILPIGISFYTFHGLSYVIDIYKKRIKPEINIIDYSLFVSFFPLLVAGPIERATHLLPQIKKERKFNYSKSVDGLRQILWGFFKKIVIADNCAKYADLIFNDFHSYNGVVLLFGAIMFSFQIYGDFSGYSDIALGSARLLGFELINNFKYPYFSRNVAEFWRRWHISLSSWFRDYVYIPFGGNKGNNITRIKNIFIIFIISGFWHGANWTFVVWGTIHALFYIPLVMFEKNRTYLDNIAQEKIVPSFKEILQILTTFLVVTLAWIFFRIDTISNGIDYLFQIFKDFIFIKNYLELYNFIYWKVHFGIIIYLIIFFLIEWIGRHDLHPLCVKLNKVNFFYRYIFYLGLITIIYVYLGTEHQFIYFQF